MAFDRNEFLLRYFDDPARDRVSLTLRHQDLGSAELEITREDLMQALQVTFADDRSQSTQTDLRIEADCPDTVAPGESFTVTLRVSNPGRNVVRRLLAQTVSRQFVALRV